MIVDELAKRIKNGDRSVIPQLWENTNRFIYYCLNRLEHHNPANTDRMAQMGITHEDVQQEAYFILLNALEQYDPGKGYPFSNSLKYAAMNHFFSMIGMRTKKQRSDILATAERLEKPIASEDGGLNISDLMPDESAIIAFENAEDKVVSHELKKEISDALSKLNSEQRAAIDHFFFNDSQLQTHQKAVNFTPKELSTNKTKALRKIRSTHGKRLLPYAEELGIIQKYAYHSSLNSFQNTWTSSTERAVIKIMEMEESKKKTDFR